MKTDKVSVKTSFYELLGVPRDARQEQIDSAYKLEIDKLNATNRRGAAEAVIALKLIREGYQILSDPAQRANYDAKLAAADSGVKLMYFPDDHSALRKLGVESLVLAALALVLGGVIYYQLSHKMDEVRIEHARAVSRQTEEKTKVITLDATKSEPSVVRIEPKQQKREAAMERTPASASDQQAP